jgi:signal transduction histidine kinase
MKHIKTAKSSTVAASPVASALKITGAYIVIAGAYIIVSGIIVNALTSDSQTMALVEKIKGMGFIAVTGVLLFVVLYRHEIARSRVQKQMLNNDRRNLIALSNATVAHDINNLLMTFMGLVEALKGKEQGDEFLTSMRNEAEKSIPKLAELSKSLACSERKHSLEDVDIPKQITNTVTLLRKHPDVKKCLLTTNNIASASLNVDVAMFEQALMNLVINAAQATGKGGQIEISLRQQDGTVILEVHDNGPGIPTDEAQRMFDTGYTTKANGSGLGMLSVRSFAASCNGEVSVGQSHLGGAVVQIQIPVTEQTSNKPTGGDA